MSNMHLQSSSLPLALLGTGHEGEGGKWDQGLKGASTVLFLRRGAVVHEYSFYYFSLNNTYMFYVLR